MACKSILCVRSSLTLLKPHCSGNVDLQRCSGLQNKAKLGVCFKNELHALQSVKTLVNAVNVERQNW